MKTACILLMLLCGSAAPAWAAFAVCFDAARPAGSRFYVYESIDATQLNDAHCTALHKGTVAPGVLEAQRLLIRSMPKKYLKVEGGLAVELTTAEKAAVDAEINAPRQALQPFRDELAQANVCAAALGTITTDIDQFYDTREAAMQTAIDGVTNIATARTAMETIKTRNGQERILMKKMARCLAALIKVLRQDR